LTGQWPRIAAYGSTLLIPVFVRLATVYRPSLVVTAPPAGLRIAGASLWLFGVVLAFWPLWHLRGSFSVEPAARRLVTSGPYQIARHPIYVSYGLNYAGLLLLHLTAPMVAVVVIWVGLTIVRTRFEERVLAGAFPEYAAYRRRVGAFGPVPRRGRALAEDDALPGRYESRAIGSPTA
jgi:protein-S-isoprenylcysteine O-methyltransferase Ste14